DELVFASFGVENTAHGIERCCLTGPRSRARMITFDESIGFGVGTIVTAVVSATRDHGFESPDSIRRAPTPNPGLTWILSATTSP
ncbi:MAG: hypothetical protein ABL921_34105, partial [Pirellula sp.]